MGLKSFFVVCSIAFYIGLPMSSLAVELKTSAQQSAPKYYKLENGVMGGICVDIIQAIERVDPDIKFNGYQNVTPFKRLQNLLENGDLDVFFGFKKTERREDKFVFVDIPLYQLNYVVAIRRGDDVEMKNDTDILSSLGAQGEVLTVAGSAASKFLRKRGGLSVDDGAGSPAVLLNMLMLKRGRFAFYHDLALSSIIKNEGLGSKIEILPMSFLNYSQYMAFSKNVPDTTVAKVGIALGKLRDSGELGEIQAKYGIGRQF